MTTPGNPATFEQPMFRGLARASAIATGLAIVACGNAAEPTPVRALSDVVTFSEGVTGTDNYAGQSVTIPRGWYGSIRFHWYSFSKSPRAFGNLYVLTQEYIGLPGALGGAPGLIGRSGRIENDEYVFPEDFHLTGPKQYWFYADAIGSYSLSFQDDMYPGGDFYIANTPTTPFRKPIANDHRNELPPVFQDANFRIRGVRLWP